MILQYNGYEPDIFGLFSTITIIASIVYIFMAIYVYNDAKSRNMEAWLWALLVCIIGCIPLIIYLIVRGDHPIQAPGAPQMYSQYNQNPSSTHYGNPNNSMYGQPNAGYTPGNRNDSSNYNTYNPNPSYPSNYETQRPNGNIRYSNQNFSQANNNTFRPQESGKKCRFCNTELPSDAKFCPNCGSNLV